MNFIIIMRLPPTMYRRKIKLQAGEMIKKKSLIQSKLHIKEARAFPSFDANGKLRVMLLKNDLSAIS